jgi:hypothetical protein
MGLVGADLADLRNLVVQLGGPLQAEVNSVLTAMNNAVQGSSAYWVAARGDKFRADFTSYLHAFRTELDGVLQQAAQVTGQNLAAIEQATESAELLPYWSPGHLLPNWGNLIPDSVGHVTSDEEGSLYFGAAGFLFSKYGSGHQVLLPGSEETPWPVVPRTDNLPPGDEITALGEQWVANDHGLLVPAGLPGADPRLPLPPADLGADWRTGVDAGLRPEPVNVPDWAENSSRGLAVAGAGLTLYSTWEGAWQQDQGLHPNWSEPARIADAAGQTTVVGGSTVAGGLAGAEVGAEGGMAIGGTIGSVFPGPGTVVGGVIGGVAGGVVGGFAGSQFGRAVGQTLWDGGKDAVQGIEDLGSDLGL